MKRAPGADDGPTPDNGQPYYCVKCAAGFGEFMACEEFDCELESEAAAQKRLPRIRRGRKQRK